MGVTYRGGKSVSRPSPRRRIPKGGISYRGGKPITGVSVGAPSVYETLTPYGQSVSRAVRGMTGRVRGEAIATYEKAYRSPRTLTVEERAMIKPHLAEFSVGFQREFARAEMKVKFAEKKEEIILERPDIRRQVAPFLPGVTPALLWGVTPETKQFAAKTWKRISEGVTPVSIAKMGVAISPVGITIAPLMAIGEKMFPTIREKAKGIVEWKPKAEREYERVHIETAEEMVKWERTPEGVPITPYELTPEAKGFKRRQEELIREASERGWKTPEGVIEYPVTERGKEWASEYTQIQEIGKEYITPEGFYREEYYVPTKEAAETLRQVEWLEKRGEEMASPTFMVKERTKGMYAASAVTKAAEFGEWWERSIIPKVKEFGELSKSVYALQVERGAPSIFTGTMLLPKERPIIPTFQVGMAKGIPDVPIMAAEVGYGLEWIGRHPKEAAMIAPGVAAYMATGMAKEAITSPVEFAGRMATMAAVTGGMGRVVRPVMPKYISGVKVTDTGVVTYKGLGIRGFKEPYPVAGMWKEAIKTPDIIATQRALVLGKEYPALSRLKAVKEVEFAMPEFGVGARVFGKEVYTETGIGRAIKRERMRMEGLWTKDYLLAEKIAEVPEPIGMPKITALPPPKPVLWERVGPTAVAERITALMKTKPIKEWGIRVERPMIPTYEELAVGRAYRITGGYDAFQIGRHPKYLKILGLDKGVPTFPKGIEKIIHPFREKVPGVYEPSMLDYPVPKGLLTEGLTLDISRAKIRPTERVPSPIEKLYERVDIYRDFGVERRPTIIPKEVLKPIETAYLKFTAEGELIPQLEMAVPKVKAKRKVEVITRPEIAFDFEVITDKAIKPMIGTEVLAKTMSTMDKLAKETRRAREDVVSGQRIEAFGRISERERIRVPFISGVPVSIFEQVEKEREKYIPLPHIPARAKEVVPMVSFKDITAMFPEVKPLKKERPFAFIMPKYEPAPFPYSEAMPKPFEEIKFRPMQEPVPEPVPEHIPELVPEPKPFETIKFRYEPEEKIFVPPPPPEITFLMPGEERKPRKRKKRYRHEEYPWKEKHYIPTLRELMRQAPGQHISKSKVFGEPKMPKLPKGIM